MRDRKTLKKKVVGVVASAGDAEGGKEGLGGWDRPDPARPWPLPLGWAGGLFALRVTRRGTGRLEALRLEGFEVLTVVSIDWLVGWLIVCLANVT